MTFTPFQPSAMKSHGTWKQKKTCNPVQALFSWDTHFKQSNQLMQDKRVKMYCFSIESQMNIPCIGQRTRAGRELLPSLPMHSQCMPKLQFVTEKKFILFNTQPLVLNSRLLVYKMKACSPTSLYSSFKQEFAKALIIALGRSLYVDVCIGCF